MDRREYAKQWYEANKERTKADRAARARTWRLNNPDKSKAASDKWRKKNPEKATCSSKAWKAANKERVAKNQRRRALKRLGWTLELFEKRLEEQANCCACCGVSFEMTQPHADHNHTTMQPRSILCSTCNTGLGMFKENSLFLRKMADLIDFWNT